MVSVQYGSEWIRLQAGASFSARTFIEACCHSEALPSKVAAYPHRTLALILASSDLTHERLLEDYEMSDTFMPLVTSGRYFLKIEEEASKYEFLRRPQLIFKKEFVDTPKKYSSNRRFEEAIEAYFRDHHSIDYTDCQRELRVQQDLKWSSDPPILLSPLKSEDDETNPILRSPSLQIVQNSRKWNKAHFQLKGDPHLGPVLMYAPRVQQPFVTFTSSTGTASASSKDESGGTATSSIGFYLFAILRDCNIMYATPTSAGNKKKWSANAASYVIILQPKANSNSSPKSESQEYSGEVKYLLLESRAQFNCWLSAIRLAKHGEILRTNFHRNVSRIKSALPVRLPSYPAGSGSCPAAEDRAGSKGNRNRNGRPLIGAFSGLQERMMNSFQMPLWRGASSRGSSSPISSPSWVQGLDTSDVSNSTSTTMTPRASQMLSSSSSSSTISSPMATTSSSSEWSLLSANSSNHVPLAACGDESKALLSRRPSRTLRDVPDVDDNLTEKNENDSRGSDVVEDSGDQSVFVPLEFSSGGGETRVLTDPEEIKEIDCYQVERYYQRNYGRLTDEPWFSCRSKEKVDTILNKNGTIDGYFVVRINMGTKAGDVSNEPFILCFVFDEKIHYKKIFQRLLFQDPIFLLEENLFCFKDVSALVDFCKLNQLNNMPCVLTEHPFKK